MRQVFTLILLLVTELGVSLQSQAFSGTGITPPGIIHCRQKKGTLTDSSNVALGFAGGTLTNMTWDGTKLVLSAGQSSGNFVSRIFDSENCLSLTPWLNFQWTTTLPFGKELPSTSETSANYSDITAGLLTSLRGLWHLNEASYNGTANEVIDSSGNGHHGRLAAGTATGVTGLFRGAIRPPDHDDLVVSNLPDLTETFTLQTWIYTTDPDDWVNFAYRHNASDYGFQVQLDPDGLPYIRIDTSGGSNQTGCYHSIPVNDGKWHHIVISLNSGTCAIYVDGVKDSGTYIRGTGLSGAANFQIDNDLTADYDEIALWDRVLSDAEVIQLYRRGANRVKVHLRTCTQSNCADGPTWKGTDATSATYFSETQNNSNQISLNGSILTTSPVINLSNFPSIIRDYRYFQYKLIFETDNTSYSPDVKSTGITK